MPVNTTNTLLTPSMITKEALRLAHNSNAFIRNIDRQYEDSFARDGAKIGATLRIRKPLDYAVVNGPVFQSQATAEQQISLTVSSQKHVPMQFSSAEMALSIDDFSKRHIAPAVNNLMGQVASDVMAASEGGVGSVAYSVAADGTTLVTPTLTGFGAAKAILDRHGVPGMDRKVVLDPSTQIRTAGQFAGLFNPQSSISNQYREGEMGRVMGFDMMMDQTTVIHTNGAYASDSTVSGANQTGTSITVTALGAPLNQGDIVTFDGVLNVNPVTKASTGALKQFTVTQRAAAGATSINIYPAIVPPVSGSGFITTQYQTVTASPANGAAMRLILGGGTSYRKNIAFHRDAVSLACVDLPMVSKGVVSCNRENYEGISMRLINFYDGVNDVLAWRLDILYGYIWQRPEWAVAIADVV